MQRRVADLDGLTDGQGATMENSLEAVWQAQRQAAQQVFDAWTRLASPDAGPGSAPEDVAAQLRALMRTAGELVSTTTQPLLAFLDSQKELADRTAKWAALQRDLAEQAESLAEQQRQVLATMEAWVRPLLGPMKT